MEEKQLWQGSPSQLQNLGLYLICGLTCWLIIPAFIALWRYLTLHYCKIEVTDQRIIFMQGVFSRKTDELELFRVKDIRLEEPFFLRLFGLSSIILVTSDRTNNIEKIPAIKNGKLLREQIRTAVDIRRDVKKVREFDDK